MNFADQYRNCLVFTIFSIPTYGFSNAAAQSELQIEPRLFLGFNASQVSLKSGSQEYWSDGYNGYSAGGGIAFLPRKTFALEVDGIYSARVFGFGDTKAFFNCLQIPVSAILRLENLSIGVGAYASFWRKGGKIESGNSTTAVSIEDIGSEALEYGALWLINYKTSYKEVPFRIEFRANSSLNNFAKASSLTGKISEYQLFVSFDFGLSELERLRLKLYGRT